MSTMRSRITGSPGSGRMVTCAGRSAILVTQASPFLPLMLTASEPQTPSRHERRHGGLDQVLELEGFHSRRIECPGFVLDENSLYPGCDFLNFRHAFHQVVRKAEHPAVRLHRPAQIVQDVDHALPGSGGIEPC